MIRNVCVFCGSSAGNDPAFAAAAATLGRELVARGMGLIYGGGKVGIMGALANAALDAGGRVTGVIPRALIKRELAHTGITDLRVVCSMHERKQVMGELSDAFVTLPGGFGTMEEFFEIVTWGHLGIHVKPCGLLNIAGYYNPLIATLDKFVNSGFANADQRSFVLVDSDPISLIDKITQFRPPLLHKWVDDEQS